MLTVAAALEAAGPAPEGCEAVPVNIGFSYALGGGFKRDGETAEGDTIYRWVAPDIISHPDWQVYWLPKGWSAMP